MSEAIASVADWDMDPVDRHVGMKVRAQRLALGVSQQGLAERVGDLTHRGTLSFQQIQKYERGANRISASMLHKIAQVLSVQPGWFFEGLDMHGGQGALSPEAEAWDLALERLITMSGGAMFARDLGSLTPERLYLLIRLARELCED